jgi:hypothetical protein
LNGPKYNNSYGGDDFSHMYIIVHENFDLRKEVQKMPKWVLKIN